MDVSPEYVGFAFNLPIRPRLSTGAIPPQPTQTVIYSEQTVQAGNETTGTSDVEMDEDMADDDAEGEEEESNSIIGSDSDESVEYMTDGEVEETGLDSALEDSEDDDDMLGVENEEDESTSVADSEDEDEEAIEYDTSEEDVDDDEEEVYHMLVTDDCSQILHPDSMTWILLPTDPEGKKKALLDAFLFSSTFEFFMNNGKMPLDSVLRRLPDQLWWSLFTYEETSCIIKEQKEKLVQAIMSAVSKVMDEWQALPPYQPALPRTRLEVELAKTEARHIQREGYFKLLLDPSERADWWIMTVFKAFKSSLKFEGYTFKGLLDPRRRAYMRDHLVWRLIFLAEALFVHVLIPRAEHSIVHNESTESLIDAILDVSARNDYPHSNLPLVTSGFP